MQQIYDYIKEILEILGIKELTEEKEQELYDFIFKSACWELKGDWYNNFDTRVMNYTEVIEEAQWLMDDEYTKEELDEIGFDEARNILENHGFEFYLLV